MERKLHAVVEFAENNICAYLQEIDGVIGIGRTIDDVKASLQKSIQIIIEDAEEDGYEIPEEFKGEFEVVYQFDIQSFLQSYGEVLSKSGIETISGINQKQLWHYASGKSKPRKDTVNRLSESIHKLGKELMEAQFV